MKGTLKDVKIFIYLVFMCAGAIAVLALALGMVFPEANMMYAVLVGLVIGIISFIDLVNSSKEG